MRTKRDPYRPPSGGPSGAASLIAASAILALVAFAAMCLSSAAADGRLLDRQLNASQAWHDADAEANLTLARIRAGEIPDDVSESNGVYSWTTPLSDGVRAIECEAAAYPGGGYKILSWKTVRVSEWTPDGHLAVFEGD